MEFIDTRFGLNAKVLVSFRQYASRETRIDLIEADTHEPWGTATVSVAGANLTPDLVAIKDYSENEGMANLLLAAKVIEGSPVATLQIGYTKAPVYRLSFEALRLAAANAQ